MHPLIALLFASGLTVFGQRTGIDLSGGWSTPLGVCVLPGTTDQSRLGPGAADTTDTSKLTRLYPFEGKISYEKDICIPTSLSGRRLLLTMERTKPSTLTVDSTRIGHLTHIYAPHQYVLGPLGKGIHHLRIDIDNTLDEVPDCLPSGHAYSDNTQTNWNGILGTFRLEVLPDPYIESVKVYPDVDTHTAKIAVTVISDKQLTARLRCKVRSFNSDSRRKAKVKGRKVALQPGENVIELTADMGEGQLLWSEFHPALYKATVKIRGTKGWDAGRRCLNHDKSSVSFGMRKISVEDRRLCLNGNKIFLRGTHCGLVFPLTGYPPMDVESWVKVFRTAREYGLNHYRFHSCAPPMAAFEAADITGFYLQPELPMWGKVSGEDKQTKEFMLREGLMLLDYAGNSPSFTFMGLGNELRGSIPEMRLWTDSLRTHDPRRLYDFGANNFLGYAGQQDGEDILITCRTDNPDGSISVLRSSFAFADESDGGIMNQQRPRTDRDYSATVLPARLPIVGHETGQFQSYPHYSQIEKYTGMLYPYNLVEFRRRLEAAGMAGQAEEFAIASTAFSMECYKEDIEYFLRTPSMAGFEMLDLIDYPGQGTALVGILDAFMDSKGAATPEEFRGFCSELVPMARFDDFCHSTSEPLELKLVIANYTESDWDEPLSWRIADGHGWERSSQEPAHVRQGEVESVADVSIDLSSIDSPRRLILELKTGGHVNRYNLWAYPERGAAACDVRASAGAQGYIVASSLDGKVREALEDGGKVLLLPRFSDIEGSSIGGLFTPDYWNYSMFKGISENNKRPVSPGTLCILPDTSHPMFKDFPTGGHSDWQWWSIARNSRPLILDGLDGFRPTVQVIDNLERCHRLGIISEFKAGNGKLMVCTCDLDAISSWPEGRAFRKALADYLGSDEFNPTYEISQEAFQAILHGSVDNWKEASVHIATDYIK